MIEAADVVAMLSKRISKWDTYQPEENKNVQEFIEYLFETIQNFLSTPSFKIYDEYTLYQTNSSDDFSEDQDTEEIKSEKDMEDNDEQTVLSEEEKDEQSTQIFSSLYETSIGL